MGRKAIIDVGSNSIKFFLGELTQEGVVQTIIDENDIARLGESLRETGVLSAEAMERNSASIAAFAQKARDNQADEIACVGTMALRNAKNSAEFVAMVQEESGVELRIIDGEEEARLSYLAVLSGLPLQEGDLAIFDTGGGSTEFIFGKGTRLERRFSVDLGAIRITEGFQNDPATAEEVEAALAEIKSVFTQHGVAGNPVQLVGMGGTVTSMGAVKHKMVQYDPDVIQGSVLTKEDVQEQIDLYSSKTLEERRQIVGLQPKRADVILAGACILKVIMECLQVDRLTISDRGLRHGLAYDLFKQ